LVLSILGIFMSWPSRLLCRRNVLTDERVASVP
jgi:hypothetical protein